MNKTEQLKKDLQIADRARRYIARCAPAVSGRGGHGATFRVACILVQDFGLSDATALELLREWNTRCLPPWTESELRHKIASALSSPARKPVGWRVNEQSFDRFNNPRYPAPAERPVTPTFNVCALKRIASAHPEMDAERIRQCSPVAPGTQTPATFLEHLYLPGENVLIFDLFKSQGQRLWTRGNESVDPHGLDAFIHGHRDGVWFLCNPVDGAFHPNPRIDGKLSRRSEESITSWRYLVLESDKADGEQWLAALAQMPLRISAIYTSGGRSIHALVRIDAHSKAAWDAKAARLKPLLTVLGADPAAITAVRLTRLPGCYRGQVLACDNGAFLETPLAYEPSGDPDWSVRTAAVIIPEAAWTGGHLQELIYLDPDPTGQPICRRPAREVTRAELLPKPQKQENAHAPE